MESRNVITIQEAFVVFAIFFTILLYPLIGVLSALFACNILPLICFAEGLRKSEFVTAEIALAGISCWISITILTPIGVGLTGWWLLIDATTVLVLSVVAATAIQRCARLGMISWSLLLASYGVVPFGLFLTLHVVPNYVQTHPDLLIGQFCIQVVSFLLTLVLLHGFSWAAEWYATDATRTA